MKTRLATVALTVLFCGAVRGESSEKTMATPYPLRTPANLNHYSLTICRFDPKKGLESGEKFVLPVDCIDEEHAISSTLSNAVAFTKKSQGTEVLSVAFCCIGVEERP